MAYVPRHTRARGRRGRAIEPIEEQKRSFCLVRPRAQAGLELELLFLFDRA